MRWQQRPQGSNWGDFGPDDQLGRVNLIGTEQVVKGAREILAGMSFCLSLPLDYPGDNKLNPPRHAPVLRPNFYREGEPFVNFPVARMDPHATDVVCDDQVVLSLQYSTQWDSLAHVGALFDADGDGLAERVYYNGYRANEHIVGSVTYDDAPPFKPHPCCGAGTSEARALGIENLAVKGMQGRGVLVDLAHAYGFGASDVGYDKLMHALDAQRVQVEPGDMLLLRTGFAEVVLSMQRNPDPDRLHHSCCALDGRDERLLNWISDSGIAALIADNNAVERFPARPAPQDEKQYPLLPLHHHCLFKLGLPLGELWYLRELADWLRENGRTRFMLTAPPLRLPGAMGSPVTPVATV
ncbi:cyclase family protein [Paraburkholderia sp. J67]|uniref:cyclase family protein n=1 Tax=Paraburkholderia sp. J67 TaxID=2805435 RepID=UPI002ABD7BE7|nr:cyclase family protein [Paraburkholderia sp. J67]